MLHLLSNYKGRVIVNDTEFGSVTEAMSSLQNFEGKLKVVIPPNKEVKSEKVEDKKNVKDGIFKIKVRQYMTKPPTKEFDFHTKMNDGKPMPMRVMVGRALESTKGMVKMELWGERAGMETHCMKCARLLTNDVSKVLGIGPECGAHNYTNPFSSKAELDAAVKEIDETLSEIKWTGWIIKSAIEYSERLRNE